MTNSCKNNFIKVAHLQTLGVYSIPERPLLHRYTVQDEYQCNLICDLKIMGQQPDLIGNFASMHIEAFREYCLSKKGVTEELPFDEHTLVYKVMGKMFAATGLNSDPFRFNVKCDPDLAVELREQYEQVIPGYHMNKKHWNTVVPDSGITASVLREFIDHSYELVVAGLSKKLRTELDNLEVA